MMPDHTAFHVGSSGQGRAKIGLSFWEGLNTGHHMKARVHCPCSRLAALHGRIFVAADGDRLEHSYIIEYIIIGRGAANGFSGCSFSASQATYLHHIY